MVYHRTRNNINIDDVQSRFAFLPFTTNVRSNRCWLQRYWCYLGRMEFGYVLLRGRKKDFKSKEEFFKQIQFLFPVIH